MPPKGPAALRQAFVDFFVREGHLQVPSAPLVPEHDPSLLFVNAGMVPFKAMFTGQAEPIAKRVVSAQKCMRVSGKHNDLEEVGRTARHHTLFEMLGNFSFGDYFKEEAIALAWRFVTGELGLPKERLYVTVFGGAPGLPADDEARALWRQVAGLSDDRLLGFGAADNFWSMGDTGPCGPCTELHVDLGEGPVTEADFASGRIVEIWNNVFMQFDRRADGSLVALPKPAVDTGMGLERVAAIAAGETSNYHTSLFLPLLATIGELAGRPYGRSASEADVSMRVLADHARALAFLVADGVQPSSDGRGYVLRRIVRRAIRHAQLLQIDALFLPRLAAVVVDEMGSAYPELRAARALIEQVATLEEESFRRTLAGGLKMLSLALDGAMGEANDGGQPSQKPTERQADVGSQPARLLSGEVAFRLYDTFGFPKDLTALIAKERGIELDEAGFAACLAAQQERSREGQKLSTAADSDVWHKILFRLGPSEFIGELHESRADAERTGTWRRQGGLLLAQTTIAALVVDGQEVEHVGPGARAAIVLAPSPLYGEGGGQVGDLGALASDGAVDDLAIVEHTGRPLPDLIAATVRTRAPLACGMAVWAGYHVAARLQTRAHHSATHLLHDALRRTLGDHVTQAGSLVDADHLRFDFTHPRALSDDERSAIEAEANRQIGLKRPAIIKLMALEAARSSGALALFGEKYREEVRVISLGESIELCGGTHVDNTGDIGLLLLERDQAVKAGVRRVVAVVGEAALRAGRSWLCRLAALASLLAAHRLADALAQAGGVENGAAAARAEADGPDWRPVMQAATRAIQAIEAANARVAAQPAACGDAEGEDSVPALLSISPQALGLTAAQLPAEPGLAFWRQVRATYLGLIQLATGRASDGRAVLAALGQQDIGALAHGLFNLLASERETERHAEAAAQQATGSAATALLAEARTTESGLTYLTHRSTEVTEGGLRALADHLRTAMKSGVVCLAEVHGDRVRLLVARTHDLAARIHAGKLIGTLAHHIDGRGGGRPDIAEAGGRNPDGIEAAFAAFRSALRGSDP